jgi:hypothetical protein
MRKIKGEINEVGEEWEDKGENLNKMLVTKVNGG